MSNFKLCSLGRCIRQSWYENIYRWQFFGLGWEAGYAMGTAKQVLEAKSLTQEMSAQLVELVALTWALGLSKGQQVNIYTDSKYAYLTLRAHAAIWKERQFKMATGESVKHFREIERLLTMYCSKEVAVIHCKGHSRDGWGDGKATSDWS